MDKELSKEKEIRALLKGWKNWYKRTNSSPDYKAGVRACIEALDAVLGPEEN